MSRGQQGQVFQTGQQENKNFTTGANTDFDLAQQDVNSFANQVGQFRAANPFVQGGQVQTAENQAIADTAGAGGEALGQTLQSAAVRGGQNPNAAIAATEDQATKNMRDVSAQEANATLGRATAGAGYGETALGETGKVAGLQDTLAEQQGQLAQGALGTEEQAAQQPSFGDIFGSAFGQQLGKGLAGGNFQVNANV
jgi:hypothetical protein